MKFKQWLEGWEQYGFAKKLDPVPEKESDEPINEFDIKVLHNYLVEMNVGQLRPSSMYVNEVVWGEQPGAIRCRVGPSFLTYVDRLGTNLQGDRIWYTKRIYQINRAGYGGYERIVAQEMLENLEQVYEKQTDSPDANYQGLKALTLAATGVIRKSCRPIFLMNKVMEHSKGRYLICFDVRGQGVEAPHHKRVEQMTVDLSYSADKGTIRGMIYLIESSVGKAHEWKIKPADVNLEFMPSQSQEEIIDTLATVLRYF